MFQPWIDIPAKDVKLSLPLSMADENVRIMFRDSKTISETIEKLEKLKDLVEEMELAANG